MQESAFTVDASRVTFGSGALAEVGDRLTALTGDPARVLLVTDPHLAELPWCFDTVASLQAAGHDVIIFDQVAIEPTDASLRAAAAFAREVSPDAFVSLGGGSVIDTAKVANLLTSYDGQLLDFVNAPLGEARPVPGPLRPHIACPTTSGTGSEVTGIAVFDLLSVHVKTGISSPRLRPTEAVIDPRVTATLPAAVVAASGLDVTCHALESLTARAFSSRSAPSSPTARPASQGANPWSDLGCAEALTIVGRHLRDAVAGDPHSRERMMWAATLAGIAFGNAGVHVPHAMAYAVAGGAHAASGALVPHGFAVAVTAPASFRATAFSSPERHLRGATLLDPRLGAAAPEAGPALAETLAALMRDIDAPNGVAAVGFGADDVPMLVAGAAPQRRLLDNAPVPIAEPELAAIFNDAMRCW